MPGQKKFSSSQKLTLLKRYLSKKASASSICKKAGISRKTFYKWLKKYREKPHLGHHALKVRRPKGSKHWRSISKEYQKSILQIVIKHPEFSVGKITQELPKTKIGKSVVSYFGVQRFLERKQLNTCQKRKEFAQFRRLVKRLPATKRLNVIERVLKGELVVKICQEYGLSRKTFYKWLKRYLASAPEKIVENLRDQNPKGDGHWKAISGERKQQVIDLILAHPELSIHKIFAILPRIEGRPLVGYYGLQKILEREGLNTLEKRLASARARAVEVAPPFVPAPPPEIPPSRLRWILAPFATIPKKIWSTTPGKIFYGLFALFAAYILEVDKLILSGMIFAIFSLFFGLVFFLYASKYYMSLAIVLSFSAGQTKEEEEKNRGRVAKFFSKISQFLPKSKSPSRMTGLAASLEEVKLKHYPFVSIHLPFYNEKRVAERILKASLALEYPNYEVIVVDDSTDETTEICQKFAREDPRIRLIHRDERTGFKGAALRLALEQMNPKTEYICVFDADFIPFPDTLEQFVKTFQVLNANNNANEKTRMDTNISINSQELDSLSNSHNIAAVQGYQWHVLNKSENWITRGVRTEYAGSYVVERSGIEVYGGLKMIAGSVYMIRADILKQFGWGTSITEDFELTLRLYEKGYKVAYTPYIQTPAECVSTIRRLIRQRMRWAEGHSHNVKQMAYRLLTTANLNLKEKLEFIYLAPYYLQATFFMIGTISWFLAEAVFKVRLPFWSAALGWSLVFVNFLSLPLMNIVGLFLEESEEKDYLGIISFILLSYIVVPFQGYAAVKGLLEKEEGPWFRTPKTGLITDVLARGRFFRFFRFFPLPARNQPAPATINQTLNPISSSLFPNPYALNPISSSNRFLSGYKPLGRRKPLTVRSIIALLLVLVLSVNYLAFFTPTIWATPPNGPRLEEQINIIDQIYSTASTTYSPTDNSLGLVQYDQSPTSQFNPTPTAYFEAVIYISNGSYSATAGLYTSGGSLVACGAGNAEVSTSNTSYTRVRTTCSPSLTSGTQYTVRLKSSNVSGTAYIKAARLILIQNPAESYTTITKTETQVEVGDNTGTTSTIYIGLVYPKIYKLEADWNPAPISSGGAVYFRATMRTDAAGNTAYAQLYNITDSEAVTRVGYSSVVTVVGTTWTLAESQALYYCTSACQAGDFKTDKEYKVLMMTSAGTAYFANAQIIFQQTDTTTNGVTNLATYQQYVNTNNSTAFTSHASLNFDNEFDKDHFSGLSKSFYFEATLAGSTAKAGGNTTAYAQLYNKDDSDAIDTPTTSEVQQTGAVYARKRSSDLANNTDMPGANDPDVLDTQLKTSSETAYINTSWLIIKITALQVPEKILFLIPLLIFLPKVVSWWKRRFGRKKLALAIVENGP